MSPVLATNLEIGQRLRVRAGSRDLRARVLAVVPDSGSGNRVTVVRAETVDAPMPPAGTAVTAFVQVPASAQRFTVPADAVQLVNGMAVVSLSQRAWWSQFRWWWASSPLSALKSCEACAAARSC